MSLGFEMAKIDKSARADQVHEAALALLLERPRDEVTFELVAQRAGLRYWQLYHTHGNAQTMFRAAITRLLVRIEDDLATRPSDAGTVSEAIQIYAAFAAEIMQRERYAQFLYLLIRDRCSEPMLDESYEKRIAKILRDGLERIVGNAGLRHELIILLSPAATRAFVASLEAELVLPKLLPGFTPPPPEAVSAVIKRVADRVLAESYALGSQAA